MDEKYKISQDCGLLLPGEEILSNSQTIINKTVGINCRSPIWPHEDHVFTYKGCYIPKRGDVVVGTVTGKYGDYYRVSINCAYNAIISDMAFEGATKRNRPNILNGNHICCRVYYADAESGEIELTCITPEEKRTWSNNENYLGVLKNNNRSNSNSSHISDFNRERTCIRDGMTVSVPLSTTSILLADKCYLFELLSEYFPYEVCVGQNGVVWFSANSYKEMLLILSGIKIISKCNKAQVCFSVNFLITLSRVIWISIFATIANKLANLSLLTLKSSKLY
ncbi:hypothetical protein FG386_003501 [Cryptosporidium ryanae]|uniref:uncharacterized protein n=1 Tax=Cryptosporidium ryanae TaxID=515981 RepID=UPI00351A9621|nr:hypothetical protein FG386_003501 [Cryptosporidium ryanae]